MTKFEYACFISYRNSRHIEGLLSEFSRQLCDALERTLDTYLYDDISRDDHPDMVFLDENVIKTGDFISPLMGKALCKSICWLVIFTRNYLGGSLWCASELQGMFHLEEKRFQSLGLANPDFSFIVPILFKGDENDMPDEIKRRAFEKDFKRFTLAVKDITQHPEFVEAVELLADKIAKVQRAVLDCNVNICGDCHNFILHDVNQVASKQEVALFVQQIKKQAAPQQPFS